MSTELFDAMPIFGVYLFIVAVILLSFEIGYQIGVRIKMHSDKDMSGTITPMIGGLLGMLAFVLAFTFSLAASENSLRKKYVLDEANVISTAYLRADLLDAPDQTAIKRLLKEYVDIRIEAVRDGKMEEALVRSLEIHDLLWAQVSTAALAKPSANTSLAVQSINEVIDMHENRVTAGFHNRTPPTIWLTLFIISSLTLITMGVQAGFSRLRTLVAVVPLVLAFSALATVIVDLDRPHRSLVKVGQEAMIDLQKSLKDVTK